MVHILPSTGDCTLEVRLFFSPVSRSTKKQSALAKASARYKSEMCRTYLRANGP